MDFDDIEASVDEEEQALHALKDAAEVAKEYEARGSSKVDVANETGVGAGADAFSECSDGEGEGQGESIKPQGEKDKGIGRGKKGENEGGAGGGNGAGAVMQGGDVGEGNDTDLVEKNKVDQPCNEFPKGYSGDLLQMPCKCLAIVFFPPSAAVVRCSACKTQVNIDQAYLGTDLASTLTCTDMLERVGAMNNIRRKGGAGKSIVWLHQKEEEKQNFEKTVLELEQIKNTLTTQLQDIKEVQIPRLEAYFRRCKIALSKAKGETFMNDEQLTNTQEAREGAQATEKSGYGSGSMMDTGDEVKAPESDAARKSAVDAVDDPDDEIGTTVEDIQAQIESTEEQVRIFHDLIAELEKQKGGLDNAVDVQKTTIEQLNEEIREFNEFDGDDGGDAPASYSFDSHASTSSTVGVLISMERLKYYEHSYKSSSLNQQQINLLIECFLVYGFPFPGSTEERDRMTSEVTAVVTQLKDAGKEDVRDDQVKTWFRNFKTRFLQKEVDKLRGGTGQLVPFKPSERKERQSEEVEEVPMPALPPVPVPKVPKGLLMKRKYVRKSAQGLPGDKREVVDEEEETYLTKNCGINWRVAPLLDCDPDSITEVELVNRLARNERRRTDRRYEKMVTNLKKSALYDGGRIPVEPHRKMELRKEAVELQTASDMQKFGTVLGSALRTMTLLKSGRYLEKKAELGATISAVYVAQVAAGGGYKPSGGKKGDEDDEDEDETEDEDDSGAGGSFSASAERLEGKSIKGEIGDDDEEEEFTLVKKLNTLRFYMDDDEVFSRQNVLVSRRVVETAPVDSKKRRRSGDYSDEKNPLKKGKSDTANSDMQSPIVKLESITVPVVRFYLDDAVVLERNSIKITKMERKKIDWSTNDNDE